MDNLLSWTEQVLIFASVGSALPILFRVRHPRTQLAYCHALLAICLLLPLIQPWQHPVLAVVSRSLNSTDSEAGGQAPAPPAPPQVNAGTPANPAPRDRAGAGTAAATSAIAPGIPASRLIFWVLVAGAVGKLCWLLGGLWQIRRCRIAAMPLYPIPESVEAANALTHAQALFCISSDVPGPVMLGWLAPVVLMPESFLALSEEAQCGVACHELLHVQRHDWLITVFEELAGALFWFNPAIWWLLAQTRLAREQLVDAEVIRLTVAREPYLDALLAIARARPALDLAPSPLFLRRRHLTHRMHSLLMEVSMSRLRLAASYSSIVAILGFTSWFVLTSFPLTGSPQIKQVPGAAGVENLPEIAANRRQAVALPAAPRPAVSQPNASPVPVPSDPLELVTGDAQVPATPADRAAALALLERAKQNSQLHLPGWTPPHRLDASFTASGNVAYTGSGTFSETWLSGQNWRWTTELGAFSQVRIGFHGRPFDDKPVAETPMRVHMLRSAIFWDTRQTPSNAMIRTASAQWNGQPVTCLLISRMVAPPTQGRLWEEEEFCIDNASGLLKIHSIAPGTYAAYSYSANLFHDRAMPQRIAVHVGGVLALDAQISVTDVDSVDPTLMTPTPEMVANGPAFVEVNPERFPMEVPNPSVRGIQPVIVVAEIDGQGNVVEEEVSAAADPALAQSALDLVMKTHFGQVGSHRETYVNVKFVPASR